MAPTRALPVVILLFCTLQVAVLADLSNSRVLPETTKKASETKSTSSNIIPTAGSAQLANGNGDILPSGGEPRGSILYTQTSHFQD